MTTTQPLQYAQIIADLQTLQNADPSSALHLLTALHTLPQRKRTLSLPEPAKFDKLGRRIATSSNSSRTLNKLTLTTSDSNTSNTSNTTNPTNPSPPSLTPSTSNMSSMSKRNSISGKGKGRNGEVDEDIERAKTLLEMYGMRGRFRQMGDKGLVRAKEKVDGVMVEYMERELGQRGRLSARA